MIRIIRSTAFIDWDTARRIVRKNVRRGGEEIVQRAIEELQESLASLLYKMDKSKHYRITMRMYHGWYRGETKTGDRRAFERAIENIKTERKIYNVSFTPEFSYGDELLCDTHRGILFDTLRKSIGRSMDEQKMVDTALTSDLLHFTRTRNSKESLAIIVGDDDDLLPGAFTAEKWGGRGSVLVARLRESDNNHLNTEGLIFRLERG